MNKIDLGYYTLDQVAKRWDWTIQNLIEQGADTTLKIWNVSDYLTAKRAADGGQSLGNGNISPFILRKILSEMLTGRSSSEINSVFVILKEEVNRFEQKYNINSHANDDYPKELRIALEIWEKVFAHGLTPQDPPLSQQDIVRNALTSCRLKDDGKRVQFIVVSDKSGSKVKESTTPHHSRNEKGHPHYAPLLEIAVKLWDACKGLSPYKAGAETWLNLFYKGLGANERKRILELTNPNPEGGRAKKGA